MRHFRNGLVFALTFGLGFTTLAWASHVLSIYHWDKLGLRVCNQGVNTSAHPYQALISWETAQWNGGTRLNLVEDCSSAEITVISQNYGPGALWGWMDPVLIPFAPFHWISNVARLNEHYLDARTDNCVSAVACHEIGHALGLTHRVSSSSCMDPERSPACDTMTPDFDSHDVEVVNEINHGCGEPEP